MMIPGLVCSVGSDVYILYMSIWGIQDEGSFERKDDEHSLGYVNVMLFVGHQNGGSNCNLEIQEKRPGDRSGSATYDCLKCNFTN